MFGVCFWLVVIDRLPPYWKPSIGLPKEQEDRNCVEGCEKFWHGWIGHCVWTDRNNGLIERGQLKQDVAVRAGAINQEHPVNSPAAPISCDITSVVHKNYYVRMIKLV
jgi:hypothetical protein